MYACVQRYHPNDRELNGKLIKWKLLPCGVYLVTDCKSGMGK